MRKFRKRVFAIIVALCVMLQLVPFATHAVDSEEHLLFSGSATSQFTDWSSWKSAVSIDHPDVSQFDAPFDIIVDYSSNDMPILVLQSWSGGTSWADMIPSYVSNGVAYYRYDTLSGHYGTDFSLLNSIKVMPNGSDLTVTRVAFKYQTEEISVSYSGLAGEIVNDINAGWNLGNTLDSHASWITEMTQGLPSDFETAWENPVTTKQMIEDIKKAGFNAVRVPVTWKQHMDSTGKIDKAWLDRVQQVVDYVVDSDMYCILNVHHDTGEEGWLKATPACVSENGDKFEYLWEQIASRFKEYDNKLLFEGFNEILDDNNNWGYAGKDSTTAVNQLNQMFVDAVRSTGGYNSSRCLVVNTYAASTDAGILDDFVVPDDSVENSIIVQVHYYHPYKYCMVQYPDNRVWTDENGKYNMNGTLYNLYNHFTSKGIPVIIGEFGVSNKENTADRMEYCEYLVSEAKGYGVKCFWWDPGGTAQVDTNYGYISTMVLYNRYNNSFVYPEVVKSITGVDPNAVVEHPVGDVDTDGVVSITDTTLIQFYLAKVYSLSDYQLELADTDANGDVNVMDATAIQRYLAKIIDKLG